MTYSFVVDMETRRPLCVLRQAVMGGDEIGSLIPSELWQVTMPKRPQMVTGTREQWSQFVSASMKTLRTQAVAKGGRGTQRPKQSVARRAGKQKRTHRRTTA